jgi:hypothetical protein
MKNIKQISILFFLFVSIMVNAQIGIGTISPDGSSVFDVSSTSKGMLLPRMNSTQRDAILLAATGLMIYNTDVSQIQVNISTIPLIPAWTGAVSSLVRSGTGANSVIGGGVSNIASGANSVVGGGTSNTASGANSAIGGGTSNLSSGDNSVISGGTTNVTSGEAASITGGTSNFAEGAKSHIGGGASNHTLGAASVISGGTSNETIGAADAILGGTGNYTNGPAAAIVGGTTNVATGSVAFVGGGLTNKATGVQSAILGGTANISSGISSSVSGGNANNAIGANSTVSGGNINIATGAQSSISGGGSNKTNGDFSTVSGGIGNTANSYGEWVGGVYGTETTGTSGSFAATDRLFNLGNGTGAGGLRNDALTILKNGLATLPSVTNFLIAGNASGKAIVTKEFTDANYAKFSATAPASSGADGVLGEIRMTSNYIYACWATNSWIRIPVPTTPSW